MNRVPGPDESGARRRPARRGLALVSVLWVLALLALIAASFTRTTRTEIRIARYQQEGAQAEALADAGVYRAILGLLEPDELRRWKADGTVYRLRFPEGEVAITIQDEIGKIDLNRAQDELLASLFGLAGLGPDEADALVDAVVDFRDPDDLKRLNGAEDPDYEAAGLPWGAKDAPFVAVEELRQVIGMDLALYEKLAPMLTVYSRRPGFNPNYAPPEVLLALPEISGARVEEFLEKREEYRRDQEAERLREAEAARDRFAPIEGEHTAQDKEPLEQIQSPFPDQYEELLNALAEHPNVTRFFTLGDSRGSYTIRSRARHDAGATYIRRAVVQLSNGGESPYFFYDWRRGRDDPAIDNAAP